MTHSFLTTTSTIYIQSTNMDLYTSFIYFTDELVNFISKANQNRYTKKQPAAKLGKPNPSIQNTQQSLAYASQPYHLMKVLLCFDSTTIFVIILISTYQYNYKCINVIANVSMIFLRG